MKKIVLVVLLLSIPLACFAQDDKLYKAQVVRVIEADIIELLNGETVRLIGMDAPSVDTKEGKKAREYLVKIGILYKDVLLKFGSKRRDRFGRMLAYVYFDLKQLKDDAYTPEFEGSFYYDQYKNLFLNATLINAGYAQPRIIPPDDRYEDLFNYLYDEAKKKDYGSSNE